MNTITNLKVKQISRFKQELVSYKHDVTGVTVRLSEEVIPRKVKEGKSILTKIVTILEIKIKNSDTWGEFVRVAGTLKENPGMLKTFNSYVKSVNEDKISFKRVYERE